MMNADAGTASHMSAAGDGSGGSMNPLIPIILKLLPKVLPQLIPMAGSLRTQRAPQDLSENRLQELEQGIEMLAERSRVLERRLSRARVLSIMALLLSVGVLITVLIR